MPTTITPKRLFKAASLLAVLSLGSGELRAAKVSRDIKQIFGNMHHALGWDSLGLKAAEKDAAGHPTLEREINSANSVERRSTYYPDGKKKSQVTVVTGKNSGKVLTEERKEWSESGKLEHRFIQDNAYDRKGNQTKGEIHEKDYFARRLTHEVKKRFLRSKNSWELLYEANVTYYDEDGSMKERIREDFISGKKTRESWSAQKGAMGRKKTEQKWDAKAKAWQ